MPRILLPESKRRDTLLFAKIAPSLKSALTQIAEAESRTESTTTYYLLLRGLSQFKGKFHLTADKEPKNETGFATIPIGIKQRLDELASEHQRTVSFLTNYFVKKGKELYDADGLLFTPAKPARKRKVS